MHELSLAQMVIEHVQDIAIKNKAKDVLSVEIAISDFSTVMIDQFLFALDLVKDEIYPQLKWILVRKSGSLECYDCSFNGEIEEKINRTAENFNEYEIYSNLKCPKCNSRDVHAVLSDEVTINSMEIDQ